MARVEVKMVRADSVPRRRGGDQQMGETFSVHVSNHPHGVEELPVVPKPRGRGA